MGSINFGGQSMNKTQFNNWMRQVDRNGDGKVTKQEIKDQQAIAKANGNKDLDRFCSTLLDGNTASNFDNLMKVAGKDPNGKSHGQTNGLTYINKDGATDADVDKSDVGRVYNTVNENKGPVTKEYSDKKKLKGIVIAAGGDDGKASKADLEKLRNKLAADPNSIEGGLTPQEQQALVDAGFTGATSRADAKKYLDAILGDDKQLKKLDGANDGGKTDNVFSAGDVDKYNFDDTANKIANANPTPDKKLELKEGDAGVYKTSKTDPQGNTTTNLYQIDAEGNLITNTITTDKSGKKTQVVTTKTDKDGNVTGTDAKYDTDGNITSSQAVNNKVTTNNPNTMPEGVEPTNKSDPKTPTNQHVQVPSDELKDGDKGVYKKVTNPTSNSTTTTLYRRNPDGTLTTTTINEVKGGKQSVTTTVTAKDGTVTGTEKLYDVDGKTVTATNPINKTGGSLDIPADVTATNAADPKAPPAAGSPDSGNNSPGSAMDPAKYNDQDWGKARTTRADYNKTAGGSGTLSGDIANQIGKNGDKTYTVQNGDTLEDIALGTYRANNPDAAKLSDKEILDKHGKEVSDIQQKIFENNKDKIKTDPKTGKQDLIIDGDKLKLDGAMGDGSSTAQGFDAKKDFLSMSSPTNFKNGDPAGLTDQLDKLKDSNGKIVKDYMGDRLGQTVSEDGKTVTVYYKNGSLTYDYTGTSGSSGADQWTLKSQKNQAFDQNTVKTMQTQSETNNYINQNFDKIDTSKDGFLDKEELLAAAKVQTPNVAVPENVRNGLTTMANDVDKYSTAYTDLPGGTGQSASNQVKGKLSKTDISTIQGWLATGMSWDEINKKLTA